MPHIYCQHWWEPQILRATLLCFLSDPLLRLLKGTGLTALEGARPICLCILCSRAHLCDMSASVPLHLREPAGGAKARLLHVQGCSGKEAISQESGAGPFCFFEHFFPMAPLPQHTQTHTRTHSFIHKVSNWLTWSWCSDIVLKKPICWGSI